MIKSGMPPCGGRRRGTETMGQLQRAARPGRVRRRPPAALPGEKELERTLRRQIAWAAGTEFFQYRDPVYHITEDFRQTFDAMGRKHALAAAEEEAPEERRLEGAARTSGGPRESRDMPEPASVRAFYREPGGRDQELLRRFSEIAFQRGTLSGAVLRGTGRMMLFSCLKKTVGQSQPLREQQRRLFDSASQTRSIPGHGAGRVVFNRGFTFSAVGLVVDVLRDARDTVTAMEDMARGKLDGTELGGWGADTLRSMYPFLDDGRERALLEAYYGRLNGPEALGTGEKGLLQNAIHRTRALMEKKGRMKWEFINKLRFISDRASEALAEFERPGFAAAMDRALRETVGAEDGKDGEDGAAVRPEPDGEDPGGDPPSGGPGRPEG